MHSESVSERLATVAASTNLADLFLRRVAALGDAPACYAKRDGRWEATTWAEWGARSHAVAAALVGFGLRAGEPVAILGPTSPPWTVFEMGAQLAGGVSLGLYEQQTPEQLRHILAHSGARVVFVAGAAELATVIAAADATCRVEAIVPWEDALAAETVAEPRVRSLGAMTASSAAASDDDVRARHAARSRDDPAIYVYTSGTTGAPKCAMISHGNVLGVLGAVTPFLALSGGGAVTYSFLPMAHVAERVIGFYQRVRDGATAYFSSGPAHVLEELRDVRPHIFGAVPRVFEKTYAKIHADVEKKPAPVRALFAWASRVGVARARLELAGARAPLALRVQGALADRLVFSKIRAAFGGRVRFFIVGAAPIAVDVLEFLWGAGLPIYEVYGMTENTGMSHANAPGAVRLGTVGRCFGDDGAAGGAAGVAGGFEHRLADDGEVLVRSPTVFLGYLGDAVATAEAIDADGWLRTGDVGAIDADGFLRLVDRKKHLIITAGGKNLAPATLEAAVKTADPLISQVHAHGDARPYACALVAPSPIETLEFGVARGLVERADADRLAAELLANPTARSRELAEATRPVTEDARYRERLAAAVARGNAKLARVERIKSFVILPRDFSQEAGELTPTMKMKRGVIEANYREILDRVYSEDGFAIPVKEST